MGVAACLQQGRYTKLVQDATQTATGTLGLRGTSVGDGSGRRSTSADVALLDHWIIAVPL